MTSYLTKKKKRSGRAQKSHIWDGSDTLCRMASTGGLDRRNYTVTENPGLSICLLCLNRGVPASEAITSDAGLYDALLKRLVSTRPGGFTRLELELVGVTWPPKKGWKRKLLNRLGLKKTRLKKKKKVRVTKESFVCEGCTQMFERPSNRPWMTRCYACWLLIQGVPS